jgi:hypothetical protein
MRKIFISKQEFPDKDNFKDTQRMKLSRNLSEIKFKLTQPMTSSFRKAPQQKLNDIFIIPISIAHVQKHTV